MDVALGNAMRWLGLSLPQAVRLTMVQGEVVYDPWALLEAGEEEATVR